MRHATSGRDGAPEAAEMAARLAACEYLARVPGGALAREFPEWEIAVQPGGAGVCTAFWRSPDGRSRRYLVARSSSELLARLRVLGPVP